MATFEQRRAIYLSSNHDEMKTLALLLQAYSKEKLNPVLIDKCMNDYNANKTEIQYLYNPIHFACENFLNAKFIDKTPSIKKLFSCAIIGLDRLKETYKACPVIVICLNLYISIIENSLEEYGFGKIFKKDAMTSIYDESLLKNLNCFWTSDRIKVVLDMIEFLCKDYSAANNVQSLEIFINHIDLEIGKNYFQ